MTQSLYELDLTDEPQDITDAYLLVGSAMNCGPFAVAHVQMLVAFSTLETITIQPRVAQKPGGQFNPFMVAKSVTDNEQARTYQAGEHRFEKAVIGEGDQWLDFVIMLPGYQQVAFYLKGDVEAGQVKNFNVKFGSN